MGKQRNKILVLGEGPTEFYYFKSLCDVYKHITIKPDYPKHTSIKELSEKIAEGISLGYSNILCVIDMDNKDSQSEFTKYQKLKKKYEKPVIKSEKHIHCEVEFFETQRCTELLFLYYYCYTSRFFKDQSALIAELNHFVKYEKSIDFFNKCRGLHSYFEKHGGSLCKAISNADRSMGEKTANNREYTYSELGRLFHRLDELS